MEDLGSRHDMRWDGRVGPALLCSDLVWSTLAWLAPLDYTAVSIHEDVKWNPWLASRNPEGHDNIIFKHLISIQNNYEKLGGVTSRTLCKSV